MTLAAIIQDRTNDGVSIVDFLFAVMRNELAGFKPCHRLDAAKLLVKYDLDEALNFNLGYIPEPSRRSSGSSEDAYFDQKLARVIQEFTDDGRKVCRFLINVMEGELKIFKPHHRISAARELLTRGFGKHAQQASSLNSRPPLPAGEGWGEGEDQDYQPTTSHTSQPATQPTDNPTKHGPHCCEEEVDWDTINKIIDEGKAESDRILREQGIDPDNPPYKSDMSLFDEAWENSQKWFEEWKNSIDPEEYHAIIKETSERFGAKIDLRIERRKQIKKDRERREKEEAERQAQQAKARAEAKEKAEAEAIEEEDLGPPPSEEEHELVSATPSISGSFVYRNSQHPKCKLHDGPRYFPEDDRSSPYYNPGNAPSMGSPPSAVFNDLMSRRRPP